jgi:hypothetical protein
MIEAVEVGDLRKEGQMGEEHDEGDRGKGPVGGRSPWRAGGGVLRDAHATEAPEIVGAPVRAALRPRRALV